MDAYDKVNEELNGSDFDLEDELYMDTFSPTSSRVIKREPQVINEIVDERLWRDDKGYIELMLNSYYVITKWYANLSPEDMRMYGATDSVVNDETKKVRFCINDICKTISSGTPLKIIYDDDVVKIYETVERYLRLKFGADYDAEVKFNIPQDMVEPYGELIEELERRYRHIKSREESFKIEEINDMLAGRKAYNGYNMVIDPNSKDVKPRKPTELIVRRGKYGQII